MQKNNSRTIAFDFDGVIAKYEGFKGGQHVEQPIPQVVEAIKKLKEIGHKILIFSTRGDEFLKEYCDHFSIPVDYINHNPDRQGENPGKPIAFVYVDDRAVRYNGQSTDELVSEIINFKAYWEK
jgi:hypothetical protein